MAPARKRTLSPPALIPNPFIKKRNQAWSLESPSSEASRLPPASPTPPPPPPPTTATTAATTAATATTTSIPPPGDARPSPGTGAEIESGPVQIKADHLARFASILSSHLRPTSALVPRLSISGYSHLYRSCAGSPGGAHFVIHQHDHPVAGTHYDLRLQINGTSSVSWAVMYGPPGDANSSRLSRNATETRIHPLWARLPPPSPAFSLNHLIETASAETGTLLLWDTGTYSVLPRRSKHAPPDDPSSPPGSPRPSPSGSPASTAQSLLHAAFQTRKIRLRLHGTRLPDPYVINLRLTKSEDAAGRARSSRAPRRRRRARATQPRPPEPETSSVSSDSHVGKEEPIGEPRAETNNDASPASEERREQGEDEDAQVRLTNAYRGASNTIGSVHQRRWYLSLDRRACGFAPRSRRGGRDVWEPLPAPASQSPTTREDPPDPEPGSYRLSFPFYVRGPQVEQSVVTGRRGEDILRDEGVTTFVPRKGWTPVMT
ncbi:abc1 domain-containing [Trichoderma cornu-damae]|uniref:Abc1 domain-containing n=1 Tax=Trichoderma cornu-damae TaxID=654480 RepID=A0A9P8QN61_9HYPO|nr:abc1 domain-containing [Trichoderma cornu-damae]